MLRQRSREEAGIFGFDTAFEAKLIDNTTLKCVTTVFKGNAVFCPLCFGSGNLFSQGDKVSEKEIKVVPANGNEFGGFEGDDGCIPLVIA